MSYVKEIISWMRDKNNNVEDTTNLGQLEKYRGQIAAAFAITTENRDIDMAFARYIRIPRPITKKIDIDIVSSNKIDTSWCVKNGPSWTRLFEYLVGKGRPEYSVLVTSDEADSVLQQLAKPGSDEKKYGQVVGFVQSGKTGNMAAVASKSVDSGYRIVVILAGVLNNLREQTQKRMEEELVGGELGVPAFDEYEGLPNWHSISWIGETEKEGDIQYSAAARRIGDIMSGRNGEIPPLLFVVKKNGKRLSELKKCLDLQFDGRALKELPILIIDDESDQASINSQTNDGIRSLLRGLRNYSYVGYSATPYANFFIDFKNSPDDLYPKDFIASLREPPEYYGAKKLFGLPAKGEDDIYGALPVHEEVPDYEADDIYEEIESERKKIEGNLESLNKAVDYFIISSAARYARGEKDSFKGMLIHACSLTKGHKKLAGYIRELVTRRKKSIVGNDLKYYELLEEYWSDDFLKNRENFIARLKALNSEESPAFDAETESLVPLSFCEVREFLVTVIESLQVRTVHSNGDVLSYHRKDSAPRNCIVIGGNKLSRGFTVEGLAISYFLRTTTTADTLMQMGRWFGYRKGYVDLTRVFTTSDIYERFRNLAYMEREMRIDISDRNEQGLSPVELPPVIKAIGDLRITSANRMGGAVILDGHKAILQQTSWPRQQKNQMRAIKAAWERILENPYFTSSFSQCDQGSGRVLFRRALTGSELLDLISNTRLVNLKKEEVFSRIRKGLGSKVWYVAFAGKVQSGKSELINVGGKNWQVKIVERGDKSKENNEGRFGVIHSNSDFKWVDEKIRNEGGEAEGAGLLILYFMRPIGCASDEDFIIAPVFRFSQEMAREGNLEITEFGQTRADLSYLESDE